MRKLNYNQIREAIARRAEFRGNSCSAKRDNTAYRIKSYDTVIYTEANIAFVGIFDTSYYSSTTSKLQGIIAKAIYGKTCQELRREKEKETQKIDYSQLYYDKDVVVKKEDFAYNSEVNFDVSINDFHFRPDCKIGHFGYNIFYRTNAGIHLKRYTTKARLQKAVENRLKKEGFTILAWIDKQSSKPTNQKQQFDFNQL